MTVDPIKINGLTQFQRALKTMDGESQKQLRVVFNRAADLIVREAPAGNAAQDRRRCQQHQGALGPA